ncbi:flagellar hook-associated protein FlgL [Pelagibaculum spongiae]|uniref:Flagellar hook-associated protein 3 n=1 Tax=Pelagibaculum spongiae TaxID=2080658 RepID=A0A2V1GV14_9GAMM|nr:flagellar hook-associated protein FlgL [Pelagibaculum spongiae]PVZ66738.1 flagellar hook-associated protein 3 [Pelagibaculum spongiae]
MRISTLQMYNSTLSQINKSQSEMSDIQVQMSTGKRVNQASDDPLAMAQIIVLDQEINQLEQFQGNANFAENRLALEDSTLDAVTSSLQRIRELMISANKESLSQNDRDIIAQEMQTQLEHVTGLANTREANGEYLFSGFQSQQQPFTVNREGIYSYQGDNGSREIEIGPNARVITNHPGSEIFVNIETAGAPRVVAGVANTGTATVESRVKGAYSATPLQVKIVDEGAGPEIVASDLAGKQLFPKPGDPAFAYDSTKGAAIVVDGVEIIISDGAKTNDTFGLTFGGNQDLFTTVSNIIQVLEDPDSGTEADTVRMESLGRLLNDLDSGMNNISLQRAEIGSRLNSVDTEREVNEGLSLFDKTLRSNLRDADFATLVTELSVKQASLQASMKSFSLAQGSSLFDYI